MAFVVKFSFLPLRTQGKNYKEHKELMKQFKIQQITNQLLCRTHVKINKKDCLAFETASFYISLSYYSETTSNGISTETSLCNLAIAL